MRVVYARGPFWVVFLYAHEQLPFSINAFSPLQRGKACTNCRRRKVKCDGAHPVCGPCSRHSTFSDCEYDDEGPSKAQMLQEQISILQARIGDLQNQRSQRGPQRAQSPGPQTATGNLALGPLLSYFHSQQTSGSPAATMRAELPPIVLQALAHNFLHNAHQFGFFLDTQAFHTAVQDPSGSLTLPPVLLNVMHLWGVHLSNDARITVYEPAFLAHALRSTASSLVGTHPRTVLHSAQASVLLATYFLRNARALEGRYHISAAVATVLSARWHQIARVGSGEEREQVEAFWSVLTLNNVWAEVHGGPSNVAYGPQGLMIDTPWPGQQGYSGDNGTPTVVRFLTDHPDGADSVTALHAKAGVLFERASFLATQYNISGSSQIHPDMAALDRKLESFTATLPAIQNTTLLGVHMLAHGAVIRLHERPMREHAFSAKRAVSAARSILNILLQANVGSDPNGGLIDPILAPLWASACRIFIAEVVRLRAQPAGAQTTQGPMQSLGAVVKVIQAYAPQFRLMTTQLETLRQACTSAHINFG